MKRNPRIVQSTEVVQIELTIDQLAEVIVNLGSDEHAELLSKIAELATSSVPMQLQYVTDDPALTAQARSLMRLIGDYSHPTP
jgi:hypothetical protein